MRKLRIGLYFSGVLGGLYACGELIRLILIFIHNRNLSTWEGYYPAWAFYSEIVLVGLGAIGIFYMFLKFLLEGSK